MPILPRILAAQVADTLDLGKDFSKPSIPLDEMDPNSREAYRIASRMLFEDPSRGRIWEKKALSRTTAATTSSFNKEESLVSQSAPSVYYPEKEGVLSKLRRKFSGGKERF